MDELISFIYALLRQWIALMSGIVSLIITIILRARGKEPRNKVFWLIAAFCIFLAFFFAWSDEHVMRNEAQQKLIAAQQELTAARDKNAPSLICKIEKVVIGEGLDTKLAQVFVYLSVRNAGAPSIAEKYKLHIKTSDLEYSEVATDIPKEYTLIPADKSKDDTFRQQDSLVEKTKQPILSGGMEQGWLRFVMQMKEATTDFIRRPGIKYTVSLVDVNGKPCLADRVTPKNTQ